MKVIAHYIRAARRRVIAIGKVSAGECGAWLEAVVLAIPGEIGNAVRAQYFRATCLHVGKGCLLRYNVRVFNKKQLRLGDHVSVNNSVQMNAGGGITIGNNTIIAPGVKIWSVNHAYESVDRPMRDQGFVFGAVSIGEDVWLATNSVILPGVTVHDGAIVAAGAVVTKDVPQYAIVAGVPARMIGRRGDADLGSTGSDEQWRLGRGA
jgi:acetyltransferase-like isoleucine patch superfamily enzyme